MGVHHLLPLLFLFLSLSSHLQSSAAYSVKKVIEERQGIAQADQNSDDDVIVTTTTRQFIKSGDVNENELNDEVVADDVTTEIVQTVQADAVAAAETDVVNIGNCDPEFASFGNCSRVTLPEEEGQVVPVDQEGRPEEEGLFKVDNDIRVLAQEANLTISEGNADHKFFAGGRANCKCGTSTRRIVGGTTALIREYPWTVALVRGGFLGSGRAFCGGTLINNKYVVTASHCVDGQSAGAITVYISEQDFNSNFESSTEKYSVSQIIMHSGYNRRNIDNDIALLKLSRPVSLLPNGPIAPACLPASNANSFAGVTATVAGWGATCQGCSTSAQLRKVDVPVVSNTDCNTKTKYNGKITENMLCAGLISSGGKDSCQGDSGGPLVINNGGRKTLIGIVSWGYGCAQAQSPGVYTRVGRYPEWILQNTRDADWCEG